MSKRYLRHHVSCVKVINMTSCKTEAVVKMIGLRHHYFTLPWNLFDLCLVSCSVVGLIMEDVLNEFPISPTLLRVVRVFRLGRVLRLVKVDTANLLSIFLV